MCSAPRRRGAALTSPHAATRPPSSHSCAVASWAQASTYSMTSTRAELSGLRQRNRAAEAECERLREEKRRGCATPCCTSLPRPCVPLPGALLRCLLLRFTACCVPADAHPPTLPASSPRTRFLPSQRFLGGLPPHDWQVDAACSALEGTHTWVIEQAGKGKTTVPVIVSPGPRHAVGGAAAVARAAARGRSQ